MIVALRSCGHISERILRRLSYVFVGGHHQVRKRCFSRPFYDIFSPSRTLIIPTNPYASLFQVTIKSHLMKAALKKAVEDGMLVKVKASYKLSATAKTAAKKKPVIKKKPATVKKVVTAKKSAPKKATAKATTTKTKSAPKKAAPTKKSATKKTATAKKPATKKAAPKKKTATKEAKQ